MRYTRRGARNETSSVPLSLFLSLAWFPRWKKRIRSTLAFVRFKLQFRLIVSYSWICIFVYFFAIYICISYERKVDDKFELSSGFNFFLSNFCAVCLDPGERKSKAREREKMCNARNAHTRVSCLNGSPWIEF